MITKNEDARRYVREAYQNRDAQQFGAWVMILLERGYETKLGARGGISFEWIGVGSGITEEARKRIANQFAEQFGKEVQK